MNTESKATAGSRDKILGAALDEFAELGLAGARRVARIARRAKVNEAIICHCFTSEEKLYQEIIEGEMGRMITIFQAQIKVAKDTEDLLLALSKNYYNLFGADSKFGPIAIREMTSGGKRLKAAKVNLMAKRGLTGKLKRIIDQGKRDGRYRDIDSRQALISFISMNLFYLIMAPVVNTVWEIKDDKKFRKERPQAVVDLFMRGLEAR
jgi:AcrR family transcriptional regulator